MPSSRKRPLPCFDGTVMHNNTTSTYETFWLATTATTSLGRRGRQPFGTADGSHVAGRYKSSLLQDLIAPRSVQFFSQEEEFLGNKKMLEQQIQEITGVPVTTLSGSPLTQFSIEERLQWAAKRKTKWKEDQACCVLGIFDIFVPLIYGEGHYAFVRFKEEIGKSTRSKLDLDKVPYAKGAMFNAYDSDHTTCHAATRVDLLAQIQYWAQQSHRKSIFWLSGIACTGKSTISWTTAEWLTGQGRKGTVELGASFFFKRGAGDRGSASRFFPTIIRQLVWKLPGMDTILADVIASDQTGCLCRGDADEPTRSLSRLKRFAGAA